MEGIGIAFVFLLLFLSCKTQEKEEEKGQEKQKEKDKEKHEERQEKQEEKEKEKNEERQRKKEEEKGQEKQEEKEKEKDEGRQRKKEEEKKDEDKYKWGCGKNSLDKFWAEIEVPDKKGSVADYDMDMKQICNDVENHGEDSEVCKEIKTILKGVVMIRIFEKACREKLSAHDWFTKALKALQGIQICHKRHCKIGKTITALHALLKQRHNCMGKADDDIMHTFLYYLFPVNTTLICRQQTYVFRNKYLYEVVRACPKEEAQKVMDLISIQLDALTNVRCRLRIYITNQYYSLDGNYGIRICPSFNLLFMSVISVIKLTCVLFW